MFLNNLRSNWIVPAVRAFHKSQKQSFAHLKIQLRLSPSKCQISNDASGHSIGLFGVNPHLNHTRRYYHDYTTEFHPIPGKQPFRSTSDESIKSVSSGSKVFIHSVAGTPLDLIDALCDHAYSNNLKDIEMIHIHTEGPAKYADPKYKDVFRVNNLFTGGNLRPAVQEGRADYVPIFLSEIPLLFRRRILNLDYALVTVSPPDKHGFCSLGTSVDCSRAALQNAQYIIGAVNPNMPRTFGDGIIHISHFDTLTESNHPLATRNVRTLSEVEEKIGKLIADNLVRDGSTLQTGIGNIPDAVLAQLKGHRDLGMHSEMFSDGVVDLIECGAISNAKKLDHQGKVVGGFCLGSERLYDFLDDNPFIMMLDVSYVNSVEVIQRQPSFTAINSAIEVDITGQVVADSIGHKIYSGVGGQIDFIRGASLCENGRPILAMPSTTHHGDSKIVAELKPGAGVVTTRAHVHYIVTEYGIAYLFGKNLRQRAYQLIRIAHPDHREQLEKDAFETLKCMPSP